MNLKILDNKLKIIKLKEDFNIPNIVFEQDFYSITKTDEELSLVVNEDIEINCNAEEYNWRAIGIAGVLDFNLVGILAKISTILAKEEISIFVISTYNTDYILLKADKLDKAIKILKKNNYIFEEE